MREHRAAIEAAGADGIIAKPITSIEQFGADIKRYMSRRDGIATDGAENGPVSIQADAPVVDRGVYDSLTQAIGSAAMAELLDKVEADVVNARDGLATGLESGTMDQIRSSAHILISVAGAIGAMRVQEGAKRLTAAARTDDSAAIQGEAANLLADIKGVLDFVKAERSG